MARVSSAWNFPLWTPIRFRAAIESELVSGLELFERRRGLHTGAQGETRKRLLSPSWHPQPKLGLNEETDTNKRMQMWGMPQHPSAFSWTARCCV